MMFQSELVPYIGEDCTIVYDAAGLRLTRGEILSVGEGMVWYRKGKHGQAGLVLRIIEDISINVEKESFNDK